ncbi:pyridoxal-phosphate-dependent aminotransferase family protein [Cohnella herbarum]|uniref:Alanine--glyoxylate aminotransferase family protein n=1 Tax=Cohnella herbarum TaxID=2728023 RepID=A0A7Z2ZNB3_9BACL|nr:alanine--glyoxylate aminotransferase family protein [Cohnella herbarum]QJD85924.1 alanine--glyoxylate aminotransferase family protein [Cohnella herbarum]
MNFRDLSPSPRTLMTPGPVEVDPRVLRAMSTPILGQFDPEFTDLMNETMTMLREIFMTKNQWAYTVDGTSRSGLEAVLVSLIESGDKVLVPLYGRFGHLLVEIVRRCGAEVVTLEKDWGTVFAVEEIAAAIRQHRPQLVAIVHGETSTGCMQPLDGIGLACREIDALLVVDVVATIGGVEVATDKWLMDAVIGGTQKCLSVPAGLSLVSYNERVESKLLKRKRIEQGLLSDSSAVSSSFHDLLGSPIRSNYLDLCQLQDYWGPARLNHHTEATSMLYALREGLRLVLQEGLQDRFERHKRHEAALMNGIAAMGLTLYGDPSCKMPVVTCVNIPDGVNGESVRAVLLSEFGIEIASSFGPLKGRIWRIGTMGYSCSKRNVLLTLGALEAVLTLHGVKVDAGAAVQAAMNTYNKEALWS